MNEAKGLRIEYYNFCYEAHLSLSTKTMTIVLRSQTLVFRSSVWLSNTTVAKHLMSQQWYHAGL